MGLQGAAVATVCGRGVGVILQFYYLFKGVGVVKIARRHFVAVWDIILRLLRVGSTGALQFLIASASWIF